MTEIAAPDGRPFDVLAVGGGPAGLAAAEAAASLGATVCVIERMPSVGRKFLMAGKSGLNLTHAEPFERFVARYGPAAAWLAPHLAAFPPRALVDWAEALGQPMFAGPSGRMFPRAMKASPLLRAWLARLAALGVRIETRTRLADLAPSADGWRAEIATDQGAGAVPARSVVPARTVVLALGGASWPRLGSDGAWPAMVARLGGAIAPFQASNVGWEAAWSAGFVARFAGAPIKAARFVAGGVASRGEAVVTLFGLEGGGLYPLAPALRAMAAPRLVIDLAPDRSEAALAAALAAPSLAGQSLANRLRRAARLTGVKAALLREVGPPPTEPAALARRIKALELPLIGPRPMAEAISTAGGVALHALDGRGMLRASAGVFCAGEMLDWDAPTGGYLLTACIATGRAAGAAAAQEALGQALGQALGKALGEADGRRRTAQVSSIIS